MLLHLVCRHLSTWPAQCTLCTHIALCAYFRYIFYLWFVIIQFVFSLISESRWFYAINVSASRKHFQVITVVLRRLKLKIQQNCFHSSYIINDRNCVNCGSARDWRLEEWIETKKKESKHTWDNDTWLHVVNSYFALVVAVVDCSLVIWNAIIS